MDEANPELEKKIHAILQEETAKRNLQYHELRYRDSGNTVWIEVHLLFPKGTMLEDAHLMSTEIEASVAEELQHKTQILTHLEPIDDHDEVHPPGLRH